MSIPLVYCGQTAGRIKMPLGTEVGLGRVDIVLYRDPAPPHEKGHSSPPFRSMSFRPMSTVAKRSPISATAEHLFVLGSVALQSTKQNGCRGRTTDCHCSSAAKKHCPSALRCIDRSSDPVYQIGRIGNRIILQCPAAFGPGLVGVLHDAVTISNSNLSSVSPCTLPGICVHGPCSRAVDTTREHGCWVYTEL